MLDDPTSSLDWKLAQRLAKQITSTEPWIERTFLVTSRDLRLLDHFQRVLFMEKGRIVFDGSTEDYKMSEWYRGYSQEQVQPKNPPKEAQVAQTPQKEVRKISLQENDSQILIKKIRTSKKIKEQKKRAKNKKI